MLQTLSFSLCCLFFNLPVSILFKYFAFLMMIDAFLHFLVLFELDLLQESVFHILTLLLSSLLIFFLGIEERFSTIVPSLYQLLKLFLSFKIIINKYAFCLPSQSMPSIIFTLIQRQERFIEGRNRRISIDRRLMKIRLWTQLIPIPFSHLFIFLIFHGSLKFIIINCFKRIFIIKAWIGVNFYLFNNFGINLLSELLSVMPLVCIIYSRSLLCICFHFRRFCQLILINKLGYKQYEVCQKSAKGIYYLKEIVYRNCSDIYLSWDGNLRTPQKQRLGFELLSNWGRVVVIFD